MTSTEAQIAAVVEEALEKRLPQIRATLTNDNAETLDAAGHTTAAEFLRDTITR